MAHNRLLYAETSAAISCNPAYGKSRVLSVGSQHHFVKPSARSTSRGEKYFNLRVVTSQLSHHREVPQTKLLRAITQRTMASTASEGDIDVAENLRGVLRRVEGAIKERDEVIKDAGSVRLVAVSKTKSAALVRAAHEAGHRYFGENYVQEIAEKAPELPEEIVWHFIGHLQSNKAGTLLKSVVGNGRQLVVETVDSAKLASTLDKEMKKVIEASGGEAGAIKPLPVYIQINSSGEESKNGITKEELLDLVQHIRTECKFLELRGLMTIGAPDYSGCRTEDFELMAECKSLAEAAAGTDGTLRMELSMGMSNDFETAIKRGSTSVRVGSSIFGARNYKR